MNIVAYGVLEQNIGSSKEICSRSTENIINLEVFVLCYNRRKIQISTCVCLEIWIQVLCVVFIIHCIKNSCILIFKIVEDLTNFQWIAIEDWTKVKER